MLDDDLIHVVDDDDAMRESLAFLLGSSGFSVRLYDGAPVFLQKMAGLPSGCILTDIRMPEIDGMELLRRVRASGRNLPVVLMTGHGDVPLAVEAMKLGASDFIEKPFDDEVLLGALRTALARSRGEQRAGDTLAEFTRRLATLSQRERQVFDRLVAGDANKVIARILDISPRTVEVYRANVMTKMQASSVSELVRLAVHAGVA
ncbi:response regulator FixJ [Aquabacter spiritensis]|uniref:LuxR family two component transcriptional regulator n=1 Tax=Aquabacter spiritensis TaxID=933073 RepID=A0A4R3M1X1_9HYPH|nr:response regulator FixJ [Aquabacter spiritensis]TCT06189.1 LuxR family two component transcriptional regulator [Aquabacter spiritensis]